MKNTMKKLEQVIKGEGDVKGYTFNKLLNIGDKYIYATVSEDVVVSYEAFIAKSVNNEHIYPHDELFGKSAWNCKTIDKARYLLDL